MYSKILIGTDGSELAGKAVEHGVQLAKAVGAPVVFVTVTEIWSALDIASESEKGALDAVEKYEAAVAHIAEGILAKAKAHAESQGVPCETVQVRDRVAAVGIIEAVEDKGCDLIVMASHGRRGISKMMLGSQTAEVLAHSKVPVLVLR